jgi:glycosyltransferase involved in cell wall biosynthesis
VTPEQLFKIAATPAGRFARQRPCPRISVVICSHNGAATLGRTLDHVRRLDYPEYEVLVVDEGSTDGTVAVAREHGVRPILAATGRAREAGAAEATGELVVYLDADACPEPGWLTALAAARAA